VNKKGKPREVLIPKHGGYQNLKSYKLAQLVYDLTVRFGDRYICPRSRTHDQMVQASRSGVQNIAEGSQASGTSRKAEIKLTNVARASLEELRKDYEAFLRQRGLRVWPRNHPLRAELVSMRPETADEVVEWVRKVHERESGQSRRSGPCGPSGPSGPPGGSTVSSSSTSSTGSTLSTRSTFPEIAANAILTVTIVCCYLLNRQIHRRR